jgi:hypothetical protein
MLRSGLVCLCAALASAGCLSSGTVTCADGTICPAGDVCDEAHTLCVLPQQLTGCAPGAADGTHCTILAGDDGECVDGVCLAPGCGNHYIDPTEQCDVVLPKDTTDCNQVGWYTSGPLGCRDDCTFDTSACVGPRCGDGVLDAADGEQCDGAAFPSSVTGCKSLGFYDDGPVTCTLQCRYDVHACTGTCGDGTINGPEKCESTWDPGSGECVDYGFDYGALACTLCEPSFLGCGDFGWRRVAGPPDKLVGISGLSDDDLWVSDGIFADHWTGAANGWITTDPGFAPNLLRALWEAPDGDVFAVGSGGMIRHWHAGAWTTEVVPIGNINFVAVAGTSSSDVWAIGDAGGVVHRDMSGWSAPSKGYGSADLYGLWVTPGAGVWIVGDGGAIFHDGAAVTVNTGDYRSVWGSGPNDVFIGDSVGRVEHWTGTFWEEYRGAASVDVVWGSGPRDVYAASAGGDLSRWDGAAWLEVSPEAPDATGFFGTSAEDVWTTGGGLQRTHGMCWSRSPLGVLGSGFLPVSVYAYHDDDVWVSGQSGQVMQFDGWVWSVVTGAETFYAAWASSANDVWFVTGGAIDHWDGALWTTKQVASVGSVWGSGPDDVWAVGPDVWHWDGQAWAQQPGFSFQANAVWGWGPGDVWTVGTGGMAAHEDALGWHEMPTGTVNDLLAVWGSGPGDVWAVGTRGTIVHWDGTAWAAPAGAPAGGTYLDGVWGADPTDVWIAGRNGLLLHYDGALWTPVSPAAPTDDTISVSGTPRRLYTATFSGVSVLDKVARLAPRAHEVACGDAVDDDGDGLIDDADPDCDGAVRLSQVSTGTDEFFEVVNRSTETVDLSGLTLAWKVGFQQFPRSWTFPADAVVGPGQTFRAREDVDLGERERWIGFPVANGPVINAWVALCAGPCHLDSCDNLLDFYAQSPTGAIVGPTCATFGPSPVDVSAAQADQSATRVGYAGSRATGALADWTLGAATRN